MHNILLNIAQAAMNKPRATAPQCDQFCLGPVTEMSSQKIWLNLEFELLVFFLVCLFW